MQGITRSHKDVRDSVRDLKFAKLTTNMTAQGLLWNTLFLSSLVRYHLFLSSKTFILQAISLFFFFIFTCFDLVFKINAIDGKKWVKFVATQQNNATLIYDF